MKLSLSSAYVKILISDSLFSHKQIQSAAVVSIYTAQLEGSPGLSTEQHKNNEAWVQIFCFSCGSEISDP